MINRLILTLTAALAFVLATPASATTISESYTWTGSEAIQSSLRLYRDSSGSVAGTTKTFPGTYYDNPTYFVTWEYEGVAGSVVSVDPSGSNYMFFSIYADAFDASDLSLNYLGDAGSSGDTGTFSVIVPSSGTFVIVASSVYGTSAIGQSGAYTVQYEAAGSVPEPASLALLGIAVAGLGFSRRRKLW